MIWIEKNIELIDETDKKLLQNMIENFVVFDNPDGKTNHYVRATVAPKSINKSEINLYNYIKEKIHLKENYKLISVWINKVEAETNKNDNFHRDRSNLTSVTYLNDDFIGGEFCYINEDGHEIKIQPKKYLTIFSNDKLQHKVLPVESGVRYSLVCFYMYQKKNKETII